jgi:membrane protease YdiL (CAAX protease family)
VLEVRLCHHTQVSNPVDKKLSLKILVALVAVLAVLTALSVFLPQGSFVPSQEFPAPKPVVALVTALGVFILYGGLGLLGMKLSAKVRFPDLWTDSVTIRQRLIVPALAGIGVGLFFILSDALLSRFHAPLPHPPFPTSLVASAIAGIGEEVIFRLFLVSFWVWLLSLVIKGDRWRNRVFWTAAVISALAFALAHLPSLMFLYGWKTIGEIPSIFLAEIIVLNGVLSLVAARYFRKCGFLAAVSVHFWTDVLWHVIWGGILTAASAAVQGGACPY